jgi:hypothetical protein
VGCLDDKGFVDVQSLADGLNGAPHVRLEAWLSVFDVKGALTRAVSFRKIREFRI